MSEQLKAQQEYVNRSGTCTCIIYHPVDEEYQRVFMEWTRTGKSSMAMAAQLFSKCHTREEESNESDGL